eukprot:4082489-Pleurochrysis_carterae.AAC.1
MNGVDAATGANDAAMDGGGMAERKEGGAGGATEGGATGGGTGGEDGRIEGEGVFATDDGSEIRRGGRSTSTS